MTITLPDGWHEVTISQFQEIASLPNDDYRDNSIISILSGVDDIDNITIDSRIKVLNQISWVFSSPNEKEYKRIISIDSKEFVLRNYRDLKIGERIDLREYSKNGIENLHKIAAILYKPEKDSDRKPDLFKDKVYIQDIYGSFVFFWNIANRSTQTISTYLKSEMMKLMENQKKKEVLD